MLLASRLFRCRSGKLEVNFSRRVARLVHYPISSDVDTIVAASYFLVPFQRNKIGPSDRFSFYVD